MDATAWMFLWGTAFTLINGLFIALWRLSWAKIDEGLRALRHEVEELQMSKADEDSVSLRHNENSKRMDEVLKSQLKSQERTDDVRDKMWDSLHTIQRSVDILLDRSARTAAIEQKIKDREDR